MNRSIENFIDHLNKRELDFSSVFIDCNNYVVTFPLYNLSGQMIGYQTYKPFSAKSDKTLKPKDRKYFSFIRKINRKSDIAVYGLEQLKLSNRVVYIVEGVFDAIPFHNLGLNCLALLGVSSRVNKQLLGFINSLGYELIAVCDGDKEGRNLSKYATRSIYLPHNKDCGDLKTNGVKRLLKSYNLL